MASGRNIDLNSLPVFACVVECGSFTAAAERLGMAKSRVSQQISQLEARLGVSLLTRTTRRISLTQAGEQLYREAAPLLVALEDSLHGLEAEGRALSGLLRIAAPLGLSARQLAPAVAAFSALHPALEVELCSSDRISHMLEEGIHLSIRMGWLKDSSQRAVRLGSFEQYVVASPAYLAHAGMPQTPEDLEQHRWLQFTLLPGSLTWLFQHADGREVRMQLQSRLKTDSSTSLSALLRAGAGLSVVEQYAVERELASGELVRVLADWRLPSGGIWAVYPPGRYVAPRVRVFTAFYKQWLQQARP